MSSSPSTMPSTGTAPSTATAILSSTSPGVSCGQRRASAAPEPATSTGAAATGRNHSPKGAGAPRVALPPGITARAPESIPAPPVPSDAEAGATGACRSSSTCSSTTTTIRGGKLEAEAGAGAGAVATAGLLPGRGRIFLFGLPPGMSAPIPRCCFSEQTDYNMHTLCIATYS